MSDFEKWFKDQDFYTNMRFIHGDKLFDKDGDVYRILPVQMTYQGWSTQRQRSKDEFVALTQEWHTKGWHSRQDEVDALNDNHLAYIDKVIAMESDYLKQIEEKDKRIEELEGSCISYKNQRDDYAQKLMVKSVHYSSIQEELAKLKDRLELAHHLATQSTWSSLKQLKKVVKALRGENANS